MTVEAITALSDNYIWALLDESESLGLFYCIDPGEAEPVLRFAKEHRLQLNAILLTHHHLDHIGGVDALIRSYPDCAVYGPQDSRITQITHHVEEQEVITLGNYTFKILFNPGHTSSHISYFEPNKKFLFCGDTLFSAGCGRVFDGTMEQLHQSMLMFKKLPLETQIFCAHEYTQNNLKFAKTVEPHNLEITDYLTQLQHQSSSCSLPSTLALELNINPFLRTGMDGVIHYAIHNGASSSASLDVFSTLRTMKDKF